MLNFILKKSAISGLCIAGILMIFAGNGIACGISACRPRVIVVPPPPTVEEMREHDIQLLEEEGVQVIEVGENTTLIFPSDLLFFYNSARIYPDSGDILNTAAHLMRTYSLINVKVSGYSDYASRTVLSEKQAQHVANFLWNAGADMRLVYAVGYGATNPVASNAYGSGRELNRRVEVSFQFYPVSSYFF